MLKVSKWVRFCAIIVIILWCFTQVKRGWDKGKLTRKVEKAKAKVGNFSQSAPANKESKIFEMGAMLNKEPYALLTKARSCIGEEIGEQEVKLTSLKELFVYGKSYKRDLDNIDDIMMRNFSDDPKKLRGLLQDFVDETKDVKSKKKSADISYELMSSTYKTDSEGFLRTVPTYTCVANPSGDASLYVLGRVFKSGGEFIFEKFLLKKVKKESDTERLLKVGKDGGVTMEYGGKKYALLCRKNVYRNELILRFSLRKKGEDKSFSRVGVWKGSVTLKEKIKNGRVDDEFEIVEKIKEAILARIIKLTGKREEMPETRL